MTDMERLYKNCKLLLERIKDTDLGFTNITGYVNINLIIIEEAEKALKDGVTSIADFRSKLVSRVESYCPKNNSVTYIEDGMNLQWRDYIDQFINALICPDGDLLIHVNKNDGNIFHVIMKMRFENPEPVQEEIWGRPTPTETT